ncbi:transcriptional regulator FilR1 domain-containing protein [Salinarchaeum laminariae]|uniref:transcriptional regulator FilR1 domain-containing protein n=1 Tax=Salinarchaeum laminariae TaxID=869888 RepID=UPI004046E2C5
MLAALMEFDTVRAYITQERIPYAPWVIEQRDSDSAGITLYEDWGVKGVIVNGTDAASLWARNQYSALRETASELTQR